MALFMSTQLLSAAPVKDNSPKKDKVELTDAERAKLKELESRLDEIKAMDFKAMTKAERKEVKNELREMKAEAKAVGGGIYISVGAIIIILLLLILLT